ncbi:MAG: hypothetical protein IPF78_11580 [Flavobacteriales bacterium]|nr:hypothetical protein [Flavobacteriales bacterium]
MALLIVVRKAVRWWVFIRPLYSVFSSFSPGGAGGTDELCDCRRSSSCAYLKKRAKVGGDGTLITLKERIAADEEEEPRSHRPYVGAIYAYPRQAAQVLRMAQQVS